MHFLSSLLDAKSEFTGYTISTFSKNGTASKATKIEDISWVNPSGKTPVFGAFTYNFYKNSNYPTGFVSLLAIPGDGTSAFTMYYPDYTLSVSLWIGIQNMQVDKITTMRIIVATTSATSVSTDINPHLYGTLFYD